MGFRPIRTRILSLTQNQNNTHSPPTCFWLPAALIAAFCLVASFIALNPGIMHWDSFRMYDMGMQWRFNDHHHPFLPVLMAFSNRISGDTSALLVFQLAALWSGIYLYAVSLRSQIGAWALLSYLIGMSPLVLSQSGLMHKTAMQTALFMLVFGCSFFFYTIKKRPPFYILFIMLVALFIGTAIRGYTYIIAIPLTMFFAYIIIDGRIKKFAVIKCFLMALSVLAMFSIVERILIYRVLNAERTYKSQIIFKLDLAGIIAHSGKLYGADLLREKYSNPKAILVFYEKKKGLYKAHQIFQRTHKPLGNEELAYLFKEWVTAIVTNPYAYFKHRRNAVLRCFGIHKNIRVYIFQTESAYSHKNVAGLQKNKNLLWRLLLRYIKSFKESMWFQPWLWFILNLLSLTLTSLLIQKEKYAGLLLPHAVLISSGTAFFIIYLFICLSNDSRFVYWGIVATAFGLFGVVASLISARCFSKSDRSDDGKKTKARHLIQT